MVILFTDYNGKRITDEKFWLRGLKGGTYTKKMGPIVRYLVEL